MSEKFNVYNIENSKLSSEELTKILEFCSDDFGGIIAESKDGSAINPITISGTTWTWTYNSTMSSATSFACGGYNFSIPSDSGSDSHDCPENRLWYIKGNIDNIKNNISIVSDETSFIQLTYADGVTITAEDVTKDDEVIGQKYSITINDVTYTYYGNSLWENNDRTSNTFIMPIVANIGGTVTELVWYRDKSTLEDFLSASAYAKLKKYLEENFVWHEDGSTVVGTHKKGDIGTLNVTNDTISSTSDTDKISIAPKNMYFSGLSSESHTESNYHPIIIDDNTKQVYNATSLAVAGGGTGATNKADAKQNLGIYYGTGEPGTGNSAFAEIGDIYFKILN